MCSEPYCIKVSAARKLTRKVLEATSGLQAYINERCMLIALTANICSPANATDDSKSRAAEPNQQLLISRFAHIFAISKTENRPPPRSKSTKSKAGSRSRSENCCGEMLNGTFPTFFLQLEDVPSLIQFGLTIKSFDS